MEVIHKIGRRKTSVARVYMSKGKGAITVNKKPYSEFFDTSSLQYKVLQPFALTNTKDQFDLSVTVKGGGIRMVERKKYGQKKARKKFQFSKR